MHKANNAVFQRMSEINTPVQPPLLTLKQVALLTSDLARWAILRELAKGEAMPAYELARRMGRNTNTVFKHLSTMRKMGVVAVGFGSLYALTPAFRPAPGTATIDFGHFVARLDTPVS